MLRAVEFCPSNIKHLVAAFLSLLGESAYNKVVKLKRRLKTVLAFQFVIKAERER